jgi:hypothetical protein
MSSTEELITILTRHLSSAEDWPWNGFSGGPGQLLYKLPQNLAGGKF